MLAQLFITVILIAGGFWLLWRLVGNRAVESISQALAESERTHRTLHEKLEHLQEKVEDLEQTNAEIKVTHQLKQVDQVLVSRKRKLAKLDGRDPTAHQE